MIETTYVRLAQAAAMLDTDADTLLIAAAEGRIQLHWLLNEVMWGIRGYVEDTDEPPEEGPGWMWVPVDCGFRHFKFIPLPIENAADLLKKGTAEWRETGHLSLPDADGVYWIGANEEGGLSKPGDQGWKTITPCMVFVSRADTEAIKAAHATPAPGTIKNAPMPDRSHTSDWLALLNQAARRWWANAVRQDPATHPSNASVAAWLIEKGMTKSLAERAASIIRPKWAHTGRKPDA